jgi:hypothetical protein
VEVVQEVIKAFIANYSVPNDKVSVKVEKG